MNLRLMLADDNAFVRETLRLLTGSAGMQVVAEASTCEETRQLAAESDIDLLLLDIRMPDGLGFEALASIRQSRPQLPVLMYSNLDQAHYLARSHELGANGYLVKGQDAMDLLNAIGQAARGLSVWTAQQLESITTVSSRKGDGLKEE